MFNTLLTFKITFDVVTFVVIGAGALTGLKTAGIVTGGSAVRRSATAAVDADVSDVGGAARMFVVTVAAVDVGQAGTLTTGGPTPTKPTSSPTPTTPTTVPLFAVVPILLILILLLLLLL